MFKMFNKKTSSHKLLVGITSYSSDISQQNEIPLNV